MSDDFSGAVDEGGSGLNGGADAPPLRVTLEIQHTMNETKEGMNTSMKYYDLFPIVCSLSNWEFFANCDFATSLGVL